MKAKPESIRYASSGVGSTQHLAGEAFDLLAGTRSIHIPYKGSSQAHLDLVGGQVEIMFDTTSSSMPLIKGGKLKPLAVMSGQRSQLPDVRDTCRGRLPRFRDDDLDGLFVTGGTPRPVVDRLHAELQRAIVLRTSRRSWFGSVAIPATSRSTDSASSTGASSSGSGS